MIDTTIFSVDIPAGTYAAGDELPLSVVFGPSVVRDGYGTALLKQIMCFTCLANIDNRGYFEFKNANWNDSIKTLSTSVAGNNALSAFAKTSPVIQRCGDIELQPNSSFEAKFVFGAATTTGADETGFIVMDIDYPSVAAVANPKDEKGMPMSIIRSDNVAARTLVGATSTLAWTTVNVDEFKAGYRYLLAQIGGYSSTDDPVAFIAFSGAPSMNGLVRAIPIIPRVNVASRLELEYSTPLVKGPMNISYCCISSTSGTDNVVLECDYIRR